MEIRYRIGELMAQKFVDDKHEFLLTNRSGSYFYQNLDTDHGGWFVREENELFRVLAEIRVAAPKVSMIEHKLYAVEQHRNKLRETFFLPFNEKALVYKTSTAQCIDLVLDVHRATDNGKGRFYDSVVGDGRTIIQFTRRTGSRDDFTFFIVVNAEGKPLNRWEKRQYDEQPARAVCRAVRFYAKQLVITAGADRVQALRSNERIARNLRHLVATQRLYVETFARGTIEKAVASFALDSFVQAFSSHEIVSGVPHFSVLSRDELISLRALQLLGEKEMVWNILFRQLRALQPDGWLPGAYSGSEKSADASAWLFLRIKDLMNAKKLQKKERELVEERVTAVIEKLQARHSKNGLAWNHPAHTWMDSVARSHASIEMQALRLATYHFAYLLTKNPLYKDREEQLKANVRKFFWNGHLLADGLADFTARPNVFLAAYVYPELLTAEEWETCFRNVLNKLWLDWGGLATIDRHHHQFSSRHRSESCYSGDSWFWINNIAAIMMCRVNKTLFKNYIDKIYFASRDELLWKGCVGVSGALSSAEELTSDGDAARAWSAATFIELCVELGK